MVNEVFHPLVHFPFHLFAAFFCVFDKQEGISIIDPERSAIRLQRIFVLYSEWRDYCTFQQLLNVLFVFIRSATGQQGIVFVEDDVFPFFLDVLFPVRESFAQFALRKEWYELMQRQVL